jgi:pentatricopeptide repeat protein
MKVLQLQTFSRSEPPPFQKKMKRLHCLMLLSRLRRSAPVFTRSLLSIGSSVDISADPFALIDRDTEKSDSNASVSRTWNRFDFDPLHQFYANRQYLQVLEEFDQFLESADPRDPKVQVAQIDFHLAMKSALHLKNMAKFNQIYDQMSRFGVETTVETHNVLIASLGDSGDIDAAFDHLDKMQKDGFKPTIVTVNQIVKSLCDAGRIDDAREVIGRAEELNLRPTVVTHNILISGICKHGSVADAVTELDAMLQSHVKPNAVTFNAVLRRIFHSGNVPLAQVIFSKMTSHGVHPDVMTYFTLMTGLNKNRCHAKVLAMGQEMQRLGLKKSLEVYTVIIRSLCAMKRPDDALHLLRHEMKENGVTPDRMVYEIIISSLKRANREEEANALSRELASSNIKYYRVKVT